MEENFTELRKKTEETYNLAADAYAKKFNDIGARTKDIERAFSYIDKDPSDISVLEVGCGNGREAEAILDYTKNYVGQDISSGMIRLAKKRVPQAVFQVEDVASFTIPSNIDAIFAFASLLHLSKREVKKFLEKSHKSLNENGIVYISLKRTPKYCSKVVTDDFGPRHFFYYSKNDIMDCVEDLFDEVYYEEQELLEPWFTLVLRKK